MLTRLSNEHGRAGGGGGSRWSQIRSTQERQLFLYTLVYNQTCSAFCWRGLVRRKRIRLRRTINIFSGNSFPFPKIFKLLSL